MYDTSIHLYICIPAARKLARSIENYSLNWNLLAQLKITRPIENYSLNWKLLTDLIAAGRYVPPRWTFYIVHTVLNWCRAEIEMWLYFSYLLFIQGELCWLDWEFYKLRAEQIWLLFS